MTQFSNGSPTAGAGEADDADPPEELSSDREDPVRVSPDNCTLYFESYRRGIPTFHVASRP
jgi:hypothetical protein